MLRTARVRMRWSRLRSRPRLLRADARRLPFPDGAFEGVYAESVLAFQSEPGVSAVVREARRVLRGGGLLVLNEAIWRPGTREEDAARAHATAAAVFGLFQTGGRAIAIDGWRQRFEGAGFEVLEDPPLEQLTAAVQATPSGVPLVARFALAARRILRVRRPAVRRSLRRYRRAEDEIRQVGAAIEARLFVLRRAEDRSA